MEYVTVDSPDINMVGYDAKKEILEVRFVNTGYTYVYEEVPEEEYENLMEASDKGDYMQYIIDTYEGYRLNKDQRR